MFSHNWLDPHISPVGPLFATIAHNYTTLNYSLSSQFSIKKEL